MKAPIDKLESGATKIIQIVVTRNCDLFWCSNCTQLLPFRNGKANDPAYMSTEVFYEAVHSLQDWPGIVAMFGGNPCVHPKFEELCRIMEDLIPEQNRRGLWTNNLNGHGEIVRAVFWPDGVFNLNVHTDRRAEEDMRQWLPGINVLGVGRPSWHSGILLNPKDLGVVGDEWVEKRERCEINQHWSAAVVERNGRAKAYFCEVASALDGVRGLDHGVPVTPGWWRWRMDRFWPQVAGCCDAGCGVPLATKGHLDADRTYDHTESFDEAVARLRASRRLKLVRHGAMPETTDEVTDYQQQRTKK